MKKILFWYSILGLNQWVFGQSSTIDNPRPKFFSISYQSIPSINSTPNYAETTPGNYESNRLVDARLALPLWLGERSKIFTQLKYKNEVLNLGESSNFNDHDIHFKNAGISFLWKYELNNRDHLISYFSTSIKSDRLVFNNLKKHLDYSNSILWERSLNEDSKYGFGVIWANTWGRFRVAPVFSFEHRFKNNFLIDLKLPKEASVIKLLNNGCYSYINLSLNGATYFIHENLYDTYQDVEYRRAAIDFTLGVDHEIHDWLWVGFNAGYSVPFRSFLLNSGDRSRNYIYDFSLNNDPVFSISLFAVPPSSLYNKLK